VAVLAGVFAGTASAGSPLENNLAAIAAKGQFSGTVIVTRHGRTVFSGAHGLANRATRERNTLDTRFNLASVGKTLTAVAIAQLVQNGKLSFDDRLSKFVPEVKAGAKVTIAQLLSHTSGLGDFFADPGYRRLQPTLTTLAAYLPLIETERLQFRPGALFSYSNSGFLLLGLVIERATHQNYYTYLREHVFRPARMRSSGCFYKTQLPPHTAIGYEGPPLAPNTRELPPRGTSAGGCYSTAGDLARFGNALLAGTLLRPALVKTLTTPKISGPGGSYGYGFVTHADGMFGHTGGFPGVGTEIEVAPTQGYVVALLTNRDPETVGFAASLVLNAFRIA
jgi:CubicO group peptidase (beta-lactamase class C family)